ncbi:MAG: hypothetical protein RBQ97_09115 [Acholeplasma sp.]|nr:hypothetical protein [Acholeplasma sp.]
MFITFIFIYRIKLFFSQIGLSVRDNLTKDDLYESFKQTIARVNSVSDINELVLELFYCYKKIRKINKMLSLVKKRAIFDDIKFSKKELYGREKEDINIVVTNALDNKINQFRIFNPFFEELNNKELTIYPKRSKFQLFTDSDYFGIHSGQHFHVYSKDKVKVMDIILKERKEEFTFINRIKQSGFRLMNDNGFIKIVDNEVNEEEEIAIISSDILAEKVTDRTTQILWLMDEGYFEISVLVCIAISLLTSNYFRTMKRRNQMIMYSAID